MHVCQFPFSAEQCSYYAVYDCLREIIPISINIYLGKAAHVFITLLKYIWKASPFIFSTIYFNKIFSDLHKVSWRLNNLLQIQFDEAIIEGHEILSLSYGQFVMFFILYFLKEKNRLQKRRQPDTQC